MGQIRLLVSDDNHKIFVCGDSIKDGSNKDGYTKIDFICPLTGKAFKNRGEFWDYMKTTNIQPIKMTYDRQLNIENEENISKLLDKTHLEDIWTNYFEMKGNKNLLENLVGQINLELYIILLKVYKGEMDIDECISNVNSHITEVNVIEASVTEEIVAEESVTEESVAEDSVTGECLNDNDAGKSITEGKFNFIEVCAGGGGLSCGLCNSGLHPILLNDIDKNSCETLKLNHPETNIYNGSFTEIDYTKYINNCDVLCGGVPCQSFSYAGKQKGLDDKRGDLIIKFSEMINIIKPKIFMIENVKGLLTHNKGETIKHVINNCLNKYDNYNIDYKLIKCVRHKIPQKRERIVIIGILKKYKFNFNFPEESDDIITIKDALKNVPKSVGAKYPEKKIKYFEKIPPGGCWINLDIDDQKEYLGNGYYSGGGKRGLLRKLSWSEPCLTILCSPAQKNTERCHPDENRPLTIRESARIQTFSDDYKFSGSMSSQYSQIGNAVPVRLGELLGLELINSLSTMVDNSP